MRRSRGSNAAGNLLAKPAARSWPAGPMSHSSPVTRCIRAANRLTSDIRCYARQPGRTDGWLAPRRTGCSASGHCRSQRPCQRFGSADERAHSPRRAWLSLHRAISGGSDPVSHEDRASRPVQKALTVSPAQVDAQTRDVRPSTRQVLL
jgi:hypothetical protein